MMPTGPCFFSKGNGDNDKSERGEVQVSSGKSEVLRQVSEPGL